MAVPVPIIIHLVAAAELINAENTVCDWVTVGYVAEVRPVGIEARLVTETDATDGTNIEPGPTEVPSI
jgi:hypothetical protein